MSIQSRTLLHEITLRLVEKAVENNASVQEDILSIGRQRQQMIDNVVNHQTEIARMIKDKYSKFLVEVLEASSVEDIDRISQEYKQSTDRTDAFVAAQASLVARHGVDETLDECLKSAATLVEQIVQFAKDQIRN